MTRSIPPALKTIDPMPNPGLENPDGALAAAPAQAGFSVPQIAAVTDVRLEAKLQHKIDNKTKPKGALGQIEDLAMQLGLIQQSDVISFEAPQMLVFAADHGIAAEGVSAYPPEVTQQMVLNMLAGGAAINVLARQHGFALQVVDAGVAADLPAHPQLVNRKTAFGTQNSCNGPAMSAQELLWALNAGVAVVKDLPGNVVAFGEMGIGNTSAAALLLSKLTDTPLKEATGRGTGLDYPQLRHKRQVLMRAALKHPNAVQPLEALAAVGGFEIAMMVGAMLQAASQRRVILVDGFIAGTAALAAQQLAAPVQHYMVFCHRSAERGHHALLAHLKARPLLDIGMRLGEGSGALLAWPLVQSAARLMNEMASFASARVSQADAQPAHGAGAAQLVDKADAATAPDAQPDAEHDAAPGIQPPTDSAAEAKLELEPKPTLIPPPTAQPQQAS